MLAANNWQGNYTGTRPEISAQRHLRASLAASPPKRGRDDGYVDDACVCLPCRVRPEGQKFPRRLERD